jgi:hypothetical protein
MIFGMLGALTLACSLFAGYDMAIRRRLNVLHSVAFAVVLSVTAYVIIDLEYPRLGFRWGILTKNLGRVLCCF